MIENIIINTTYYKQWLLLSPLKKSTKLIYTSTLKSFADFLKQRGWDRTLDFDKFYYCEQEKRYNPINTEFIDEYVTYLTLYKSSPNVYNHLAVLKRFFNFLEEKKMIKHNPLRNYPNLFAIKRNTTVNKVLSKNELYNLINSALTLDPIFKQLYTLIMVQLSCGLKSNEICNLTESKVDFENDLLIVDSGVRTKANTVAMAHATKKALYQYLQHPAWKSWKSDKEDKEVFFYKNKPLTNLTLNQLIKKVAKKASIKRNVTSKLLRVTMAHLLYNNGASIFAIQQQMRHTS